MAHRERLHRPDHIYPVDEWRLVEQQFSPDFLAATETLFSTANGYLGIRAGFEEGAPAWQNGTFINHFYESRPIVYGEEAFGFARTGQTIVNVPDGTLIKLYVDDEPFYLPTATVDTFERALDMRSGTLDREVIWEKSSGKRVSIKSRRLVSFVHKHVAAISYEIVVLNADAPVVIASELVNRRDGADENNNGDPRARIVGGRVLKPRVHRARDERVVLGFSTRSSGLTLACASDHVIETDAEHTVETTCGDDSGQVVFSVAARRGAPIRVTKFLTYHTSRRVPPTELCQRAEWSLDRAVAEGFDSLVTGQREFLDDFWHRSDVQVTGDRGVQQTIRFNLFQICQATARAEGAGVPAKGMTGQGYEGHYFWDTEVYVLPFLIYTTPRIAKNLLRFRHSYIDKARARAAELNQKGALFPWRTISGEEASAHYASGTAQYHINADIMYALKKYVEISGDTEFLTEVGAEMLVETARFWFDLGFFSPRKAGRFVINGVTGPDEYNTVVDNNCYTNLMARENLRFAAKTVDALIDEDPRQFVYLAAKTGVSPDEITDWRRAAEEMYVPFDEERWIHLQDDGFLDKEKWDFENTPPENYPLLLHYHPLVIYRHQVVKQADVVLAMFLLGHEFTLDQKRRNFDHYDRLTTRDSSLSACVESIVASEVGYTDKALEYARYAGLMDLADVAGNVKDGCHIASMGGFWMTLVYGFAGMRDYDGHVSFTPRVSERLRLTIRFKLTVREQLLSVAMDSTSCVYTLCEGSGLTITHCGESVALEPGVAVTRPIVR
jgi:alpha,alpha-trehalose phosphorylase